MPKQFILSFVFILLSSLSLNAAAIVDGVYGMVVQDPAALVKAMDTWNASADSDGDQTVTLYETIANGEDPSTHLIVGDYQDYAAFEKQAGRMRTSADFAQFIQDLSAVAKPAWESISVHLATYGKGWNEHNHVAAVSLRVENPRAYAQAFDELMKSKAGKNLKGATKLVGVRAGSGVSHIVVITGASFAEINEGLDAMYASEEFSNFVAKVRGDREVLGTAFYRVVKRWQH